MLQLIAKHLLSALFCLAALPGLQAKAEWKVLSQKAPARADQERILQFWTEKNIAAAKPLDLLTLTKKELNDLLHIERDQLISLPHWPIMRLPSGSRSHHPSQASAESLPGQVQRADPNVPPFNASARLFFKLPNGELGTCSAQYVGSSYVIMTAAHCVIDENGTWHHDFLIPLAARSPSGKPIYMKWVCMSVLQAFLGPAKHAYDYAFIYTDFSGVHLGFTTDFRFSEFESIGYPSNYENGLRLMRVKGSVSVKGDGVVLMRDNPFGPGSSGGAWIGDLNEGESRGNYAIGLNSFKYDNKSTVMGGPRFNIPWYLLWDFVDHQKCMQ